MIQDDKGRDDPLRDICARDYVEEFVGPVNRAGFATCPFHADGQERAPSLHAPTNDILWCCHSTNCPPRIPGAQKFGGDIYVLVGALAGYDLPLRQSNFLDVQGALHDHYLAGEDAA